ncbi:hypothetical protein DL766_005160 [Monosporascus sp. MC13-8B]|uniref:Uncharacterized protein n=1 Tax=Monosporascus cannonballus TaxID=155416 RepID=A0ABY0HLT3_9PEZI|nr:hypothetical protein DL763_005688 [Monosporascus cannonballus]RYO94300.1 hypothetical protein DL762_000624 [Monosporascus cannonballus]RYP29861.1 hypothetical protein DL766_005160 [Monosporascus sp. MC13-8B]
MAPKRGTKMSFDESGLEQSTRPPEQTRLSLVGSGLKPTSEESTHYREFTLVYKDEVRKTGLAYLSKTADDFAEVMSQQLPLVKKLKGESASAAFSLLLYTGDHAYGDLEACCKSGGFGHIGAPYKAMDRMLVELITAPRAEAQAVDEGDPGTPAVGGSVVKPSTADAGHQEKMIRDASGGSIRIRGSRES